MYNQSLMLPAGAPKPQNTTNHDLFEIFFKNPFKMWPALPAGAANTTKVK